MDTREYTEKLLLRFQAPPPSDVIKAAERLSVHYLTHLVMLHKYLQVYGKGSRFKRIQLHTMTRVLDGFVGGARLLRARIYNAALAEMRGVLDALNLMNWLALAAPALELYLSKDTRHVLREFTPERVRACIGRTPHDVLYEFLTSYQTHPFYTGQEYLLSVSLSRTGEIERPKPAHFPALDAVTACVMLMTYSHATYGMGTNFGLEMIVDQDRDLLARMYRDIGRFLDAVERMMGDHRSIRRAIRDFREHFPKLFERRFSRQQKEMHEQFQNIRQLYKDGRLPFPPDSGTVAGEAIGAFDPGLPQSNESGSGVWSGPQFVSDGELPRFPDADEAPMPAFDDLPDFEGPPPPPPSGFPGM